MVFPNQRVEYNNCFVACDVYSGWPIAIVLQSANAKSICDSLMKPYGVREKLAPQSAD